MLKLHNKIRVGFSREPLGAIPPAQRCLAQ
jgi:hypothetical protein